jgi:hypothetical protein
MKKMDLARDIFRFVNSVDSGKSSNLAGNLIE